MSADLQRPCGPSPHPWPGYLLKPTPGVALAPVPLRPTLAEMPNPCLARAYSPASVDAPSRCCPYPRLRKGPTAQPHPCFVAPQEWTKSISEVLSAEGSKLDRQLSAMGKNMEEAAGELGSGLAGGRSFWLGGEGCSPVPSLAALCLLSWIAGLVVRWAWPPPLPGFALPHGLTGIAVRSQHAPAPGHPITSRCMPTAASPSTAPPHALTKRAAPAGMHAMPAHPVCSAPERAVASLSPQPPPLTLPSAAANRNLSQEMERGGEAWSAVVQEISDSMDPRLAAASSSGSQAVASTFKSSGAWAWAGGGCPPPPRPAGLGPDLPSAPPARPPRLFRGQKILPHLQ